MKHSYNRQTKPSISYKSITQSFISLNKGIQTASLLRRPRLTPSVADTATSWSWKNVWLTKQQFPPAKQQ